MASSSFLSYLLKRRGLQIHVLARRLVMITYTYCSGYSIRPIHCKIYVAYDRRTRAVAVTLCLEAQSADTVRVGSCVRRVRCVSQQVREATPRWKRRRRVCHCCRHVSAAA